MTEQERVESLLKAVYGATRDEEPDLEQHQRAFVFHMLDAADDVRAYVELLERPQDYDAASARKVVVGIVNHAVNHFAAAARLYDEFADPFKEPSD